MDGSGQHIWSTAPSGTAGSTISFTQAMTLTAAGDLLVGQVTQSNSEKFGVVSGNSGAAIYARNTVSTGFATQFTNSNATGNNQVIYSQFSAQSPNNSTAGFFYAGDSTALRVHIYSNGGIANYQANNINLSDARLKTAIYPAPSYLDKINAIEVVIYKYKDQTHDDFNLGAIAQQVLSVAQEFVDQDGFGETPEDGVPLMAIYETDLKYAMLKAIQELSAKVTALEAKVN
jgi:hypothetical protein